MIAANVAAAKALEAKKAPVMYRVHEPPSREKLVALKDYLETFGIELRAGPGDPPGDVQPHPRARSATSRVPAAGHGAGAAHARPRPITARATTAISAWRWAATRISPRRSGAMPICSSTARWSRAYELGAGRADRRTKRRAMERIGEAISRLERRAMEAERETIDRYVAAYLVERVGEVLDARITGVQNFGFFATVEGIGGDGLVPVRDLGGEYFRYRRGARRRWSASRAATSSRIGQRLQAAAGGGQSGVGRAALRTARGQGAAAAAGSASRRACSSGAGGRRTSAIRASGGNRRRSCGGAAAGAAADARPSAAADRLAFHAATRPRQAIGDAPDAGWTRGCSTAVEHGVLMSTGRALLARLRARRWAQCGGGAAIGRRGRDRRGAQRSRLMPIGCS